MNNIKKFILVAAAALFSAVAFAQGQKITAKLIDGETKEPLPFATVSVTKKGETKALKYSLSTSEGFVSLDGVKKGEYTLKVELMGYKTFSKEIKMEPSGSLSLGDIIVEPDAQVLDAAKVTGLGQQIVVKKDTIEYNATLFKTSDNDMLIDLLKKLPGIEVESDGSITANGKSVSKITIDGKTFFLDDPKLATQNIPSKIIEKVKVVDKKSDQAMFTGIDDGEEETVIDLGVKKGMMKGWFGNVMGGGGHDVPSAKNNMNDWRYQAAGFVGNFTDKQQISVILNANNTNNRGFNDLAGNMMGGMRGGGGRGFGRGGDVGVTSSWMGGINGAWDLLDNRMELGGNYLYNGSKKYIIENSVKNTFLSDTETLNYNTQGTNTTNSGGHRIGIRLDHKFSDNTSLLFEPQFNIGNGSFFENSTFTTDRVKDGATGQVNDGFTNTNGANKNWTASGRALLRQKLGKPGRTMTVNLRWNFSNNDLTGLNQSLTNPYEVDQMSEQVNQRYVQNATSSSLTGGLTYTEPLWKNWYLEANYSYTWREQKSYKDTWDSGAYSTEGPRTSFDYNFNGETYNDTYSNSILNLSRVHRAGANIMYQIEKLRAQLGVSANPEYTYNKTKSDGKVKEYTPGNNGWVTNIAPQASFSYDFSDNSNIRAWYNGRSSQPSTSQLMPVPDNSDPLNVSLGNPTLKPYFSHNFRGMFRYTNKENFLSINAFLDGGLVQNPIINTTWYSNTGAQYSLPTNGPDRGNVNARIIANIPIGKSKFNIFNMLNLGYSKSSNYMATGTLDMSKYISETGAFNYDLFLSEYGDFSQHPNEFALNTSRTFNMTERLRGTYRGDAVEVSLGARTRMSKPWYTVSKSNSNTTWSNQAEAEVNWTIPGGVNLISRFNYNWYNGYTTQQEPTAVLNAEITKLLFKNKVTLALKGYDLLAQARNLSVSDTENYHQETRNNTLGRYIILSITYRFGSFNKFNERMSAGPGGNGRPPMGPPPGH